MKQRTALVIAAALTAFVLVLAASVTMAITAKSLVGQVKAEPTLEELDSIKVEAVSLPIRQPTNTPHPTQTPLPTRPPQPKIVSAARATQLAILKMPGAQQQKPPELVNYKGKMAYEVVLSSGTVYIDGFNGGVLGTVAAVPTVQPPPEYAASDTGGGGGGGGDPAPSDNPPTDQVDQSPPAQDTPIVQGAEQADQVSQEPEHEDNQQQDHQVNRKQKHQGKLSKAARNSSGKQNSKPHDNGEHEGGDD